MKLDIRHLTIKSVLLFVVPFILENGFIQIASLTDTAVVSCIGVDAVAAVGAMGIVLMLVYTFPRQVATASQIILSRLARKNKKQVNNIIVNSLYLSTAITLFTTGGFYLCRNFIAGTVMNLTGQAYIDAVDYLSIRLVGSLVFALSIVYMRSLKALGYAKKTLLGRSVYTVLVVITDIAALKLGYGVKGIAFATVFCELVELIYYVSITELTPVTADKSVMSEMLKIYYQCVVSVLAQRFGVVVFTSLATKLGKDLYSLQVMTIQIVYFVTAFGIGLAEGLLVLLGNTIATNNKRLVKVNFYVFKRVILRAVIFFGAVSALISYPLLKFMTNGVNFDKVMIMMAFYVVEIMCETVVNPYEYMLNVGKELRFTKRMNIIGVFLFRNMFLMAFLAMGLSIYGVAMAITFDYVVRYFIYAHKIGKDYNWIKYDKKTADELSDNEDIQILRTWRKKQSVKK